jgi:PhnB protein
MAKRSVIEQLDDAVEAMMGDPNAPPPRLDPRVAELLRIAAVLRDLPAPEFKSRLQADLHRQGAPSITAKPIPAGYHTATVCLVVRDAPEALAFYKRAFGATEVMRLADPSGQIMHAEMQIGDSRIALAPEAPDWGNRSPQLLGGSPVIVQLYVEDVDTLANQAVAAGAQVIFPVADQFYGDRAGRLADPFGHIWIVSTHKEDVSVDEMRRRAEAWMQDQQPAAQPAARPAYRVEPYLRVSGAARLSNFLTQAFGARETACHRRPDGSIVHAEATIGDSVIGMGDATDETAPAPTAIHLYVPDADAVYRQALRAGATSMHEPVDQDYGDREAGVKDPFGNHWYIATHQAKGARPVHHVPEGLHTINSYLHPKGAPQLIDFLKRAFEAEEAFRAQAPDGTVVHAKIRIGESVVEMGEAHGPYQPMPTVYHLYVTDSDEVYRRALAAGGISLSAPADQPWGYRNAGVQDPGGNQWWINAPLAERPSASAAPRATAEEERIMDVTDVAQRSHSVTPFLQVQQVRQTVDFLKEAFGAELTLFDRGGDPPHDHAQMRIGDSAMMMGEAIPGHPPTSSSFYLHVSDVDAAYERALRAGAASQQPPRDMPWGDRMAHVKDPFGNSWFIAARKKDVQH